jgi:hypothetical protein
MTAIAELHNKELTQTKAGKAAAEIHALDQAETIATRIKNASALEKALLQKLESQRDFSREYKNKFPHGGERKTDQDDTSVVLKAEKWCQSYGFHIRTVQRWCDLLEEARFLDKKNSVLQKCWALAELWQAANFSSDSVEWYTPARYLEAVREVLGEIDLDPASNPQANATIGAKAIFTKENDGLKLDWWGRVFMNPPYGKADDKKSSLAGEFCKKAVQEYEAGNIDACIILVNSLHSQAWQAPLYNYAVCFVDHRIQFISGDGDKNKNPTFQNIFVYLGKDVDGFAAAFHRYGYVMRKVSE